MGNGHNCNFCQYNMASGGVWDYVISNMSVLFPITSLTNIAAFLQNDCMRRFFPFKHRVIRKWIFGVIITVVWVTAALITTVTAVGWFYTAEYGISWKIFHTSTAFSFIWLLVIFVSSVSIAVKIHCGAHPQHHGGASRERKLTKTLFIVTLVSLLMWLPYAIFIFLSDVTKVFINSSWLLYFRINDSLVVLFYANSLFNPIVHTFGMPEFKRAQVSLFRRRGNFPFRKRSLPFLRHLENF